MFAAAFVITAAGEALRRFGIAGWLGELATPLVFIYLPLGITILRKRNLDSLGLVWGDWKRAVALVGAVTAVCIPLYLAMVYFISRLQGFALAPAFHWSMLSVLIWHLFGAAIPEELFFRGYMQPLAESRFSSKIKVLGAEIGWGVVLTAALFALIHLAAEPSPQRLATFFPGLIFGWLRAKTGSILAPTLFHFLANATVVVVFAQ